MRASVATLVLIVACGCRSTRPRPPDPAPASASPTADENSQRTSPEAPFCALPLPPFLQHDSIVICGTVVHIGTPVVLWTEPPYYDASSTEAFERHGNAEHKTGLRFQPGRMQAIPNPDYAPPGPEEEPDERTAEQKQPTISRPVVSAHSRDIQELADVVDQFVIHYDVCGLSRTCFRVLQDERMLSVHFLLDIDGTIYQTLNLRDTAWHATKSNPRSIGIEIANMGAYPRKRAGALDRWYRRDSIGTYISIPSDIFQTGVLTQGFVGRPARGPEPIVGIVQGEELEQYDFTRQQYASLVKLTAALCRELPKIKPDAPRDADGKVVDHVLDDDAWRDFHGILGHFHVQKNKTDPGPAFDWEPFLEAVRSRMKELDQPGG